MLNMYWKYAGTQYKSKFHAIQAAKNDVQNISFHTFDESLFNYDYTVEPSESLQELIKERCLEIRDTYPYIKFFLSGGSDSTTVLNCFLKNNIPIDEIVIYRFSPINDFQNNSNSEVNDYTIPYAKSLDIKVSIHDWGSEHYDKLFSNDNWFDKRNTLSLREINVANIRGKNFCNLFCDPEPRIEKVDGRWNLFAYDTDSFCEEMKFRNIVPFFYTPKLLAKQAHLLKQHCDKFGVAPTKTLLRELLRDEPIAKVQLKGDLEYSGGVLNPLALNPKERLMFKGTSKSFQDRYSHLLSTRVGGVPVLRLLRGYELFRFDLGD